MVTEQYVANIHINLKKLQEPIYKSNLQQQFNKQSPKR